MRLSIRYRLLIPLVLLLAGNVAVSLLVARYAVDRAGERTREQIRSISRTLGEGTFPLTQRVLDQIHDLSGAGFLLVRDSERIATFADASVAIPTDPDEIAFVDGEACRVSTLTLHVPHPDAGALVAVFYPERLRTQAIRDAVEPAVLLGLVSGTLAVLISLGIAGRIIGRIRQTERRTRGIATGDFTPIPLPRQDDELRDLSASINDMAERLTRLQDSVRRSERIGVIGQLAGGMAHQMRNAATGARLAMQVHLGEHPEFDGPDEAPAVVLRQLSLMEASLRQFLELGRPENRGHRPVDLAAVVGEVLSLLRAQADHMGTALTADLPVTPLVLDGDPVGLGHLVLNLIENAIQAAGPDGTVRVRSFETPTSIRLEIRDDGPGPHPDVADRMFEAFVTGRPDGIGLGLAVALQAAQAHRGRIDWERIDGETAFRVEWPVGPDG